MARLLLAIVKSPENIPTMTKEELAYALLEDMQARLEQPINGMLNRHHVGTNLFSVGAFYSSDGSAVMCAILPIVSIGWLETPSLCWKDGIWRSLRTT
jgi:hypothetical protein